MENSARNTVAHGSPSRGMFHDICTPGLFAKHPRVGLAMFLISGLVFGVLAYNLVNDGPLVRPGACTPPAFTVPDGSRRS